MTEIPTKRTEICPKCDGQGKVFSKSEKKKHPDGDGIIECPRCGGDGLVEPD